MATRANKTHELAVPSGHESISIRKISNGFIVSKTGDKGYSETFCQTKPKIEIAQAKKPK